MRTMPCALTISLILAAVPTCCDQSAAKEQTAGDPRWGELPHTDTEFVPPRYDSLDAWQKRREHLRRQILWAAGLWPMSKKTPLRARIVGRIEHEDYTIEKAYFESIPGLFVTGNLYRPRKTSPRGHPGVLNPHGHAMTGRLHDNEVASYQARCITFARLGCVAFMWDMIEYNDSAMQLQGQYQKENYWNVHNAPWKHEPDRRTLWYINALGIQLWNSIRALDFLSSLPEVDPQRLAYTGESGGGTQAFMLAAVDDRVSVAAPVCMVSSYMQGGCNCENAPGLRIDTHNTEFAAVMAPRPMMLVSATGDWTSHTPEVEMPAIKNIYALYGAEDKLAHAHSDAGHGYNLDMRNAVYPWFARWLSLPISENFSEPTYSVEKADDLLVFKDSVPDHAICDHETLIERMVYSAKRRLDYCKPVTIKQLTENRRIFSEGLRLSVGDSHVGAGDVFYEQKGTFELNGIPGECGVITGEQRGVRIPVWILRPERPSETATCTLLVHGAGRAELAKRRDLIRGLLVDGQTVYILEPFGVGEARAGGNQTDQRGTTRYFTTFNRTDDAERVYDVLTAIAYCRWHGSNDKTSERINVVGVGQAGPWIAIAGAVVGSSQDKDPSLRFAIDGNQFDTSSEKEYMKSLFIPGILRAGGLPNALALIAPHAMLLHNTGSRFGTTKVKAAYALKQTEVIIHPTVCYDANLLAFITRENVVHDSSASRKDGSSLPFGGLPRIVKNRGDSTGLKLEKKGTEQVYFTFNGKPLLSFGGLSDFIFYAADDAYDYKLWADWAAEHGMNHIRAYPPLSWKYIERFAEDNGGKLENVLFPYNETKTGNRRFDLTDFNKAYWARFREKCEYLESKGIILHLLMWNGWQLRALDTLGLDKDKASLNWAAHFFNPANNIHESTKALGGKLKNRYKMYESVADRNTESVELQRAWFLKLIEVTANLNNVYYDLVHELGEHQGDWEKTKEWIDEMVSAIRQKYSEVQPNKDIIIGMDTGGLSVNQRDWIFTRPYFDLLIFGKRHTVEQAVNWRKQYKKPYIPQESWDDDGTKYSYMHPEQRVHTRKYMWKFMMNKCQQMDLYIKKRPTQNDNLPRWPHNYDPRGRNPFEQDALRLRKFWNTIRDYENLWFNGKIEIGPGEHRFMLTSSSELVLYFSSATTAKNVQYDSQKVKLINLPLKAGGNYGQQIYDPQKGELIESKKMSITNGEIEFILPTFTDDIVVHIYAD